MKIREWSLAGFVLAAFGASIAACSAHGTTAAPDDVDEAGGVSLGEAGRTSTGTGGAPVSAAAGASSGGAVSASAGAPAAHAGSTSYTAGHTGMSFGGAPAAAGASSTGVAGAATTTGGCVAAVGTATDLLIDDLDDGDNAIKLLGSRKGFWYTFNDGTATQVPTSSATVPFTPTKGGDTTTSVYDAETSGPAFTSWGAGIGFDFNNASSAACPYNGSAYTGITFWAKSNAALKAMVKIPATTAKSSISDTIDTCTSSTACNDHFYIPVTAGTAWAKYTITFGAATFKQEGWGTVATFDKTKLLGMQFQVAKGIPFDFAIDDVNFF